MARHGHPIGYEEPAPTDRWFRRVASPRAVVVAVVGLLMWCGLVAVASAADGTNAVYVCTDSGYVPGTDAGLCAAYGIQYIADTPVTALVNSKNASGDQFFQAVGALVSGDEVYVQDLGWVAPETITGWLGGGGGGGGGGDGGDTCGEEFTVSCLDTEMLGAMWTAGFVLVGISWAIGMGFGTLLGFIKR